MNIITELRQRITNLMTVIDYDKNQINQAISDYLETGDFDRSAFSTDQQQVITDVIDAYNASLIVVRPAQEDTIESSDIKGLSEQDKGQIVELLITEFLQERPDIAQQFGL